MTQPRLFLSLLFLTAVSTLHAQTTKPASQAFELRYVTTDPAADGETDFKGPTAWFDTPRRIEYLKKYADFASRYFDDRTLAEQVVSDGEVERCSRSVGVLSSETARFSLIR